METALARPPRHDPVQDRGRRTRDKVLQAARRVLVRRGYEAARVEEITKLARVGYGTFYKYFHNKQDVLEAVMEDVYRELNQAGFPAEVDADRLEDQIRTGIRSYLQVYYRNREVLLALQPASLMSPRVREYLGEMRERDVQWMVTQIRRLSDQGWAIRGNPEVLAVSMLATVEVAAQDWIRHRTHLELEDVAVTLYELWVRTIRPFRPAPESA